MGDAEGRDRPVGEASVPDQRVDELALAQLAEITADEDGSISGARRRAGARSDLPSAPAGAFLRWLASTLTPGAVVEIGAAAGVSGLQLLRGVGPRTTLTSVERDPDDRELAAEAFTEAGVTGQIRSIPGEPLDALSRLTDDGYDLVVLNTANGDQTRLLDEIGRVLRPGGVLAVHRVAPSDQPALRRRQALVQQLVDGEEWSVAVLPFDGGIAVATLRGDDQ